MLIEQKKKLRNPIVQQYLFELVLPFAGYFFFDWSILIIGIYYLIDQFVGQLLFVRRYLWVANQGKVKKIPPFLFVLIIPHFLIIFFLESYAFHGVLTELNGMSWSAFKSEIGTFAAEELWLLFPVMLLAYHMMDQFSFYMPRRYLNFTERKYGFANVLQNTLILALTMIIAILAITFRFSDTWLLIIFVLLKIGFDLFSHQFLMKRIQNDK